MPDGWAWARLGVICPYGENKAVSADLIDETSWILDLEDIEKETGVIKKYATKSKRNSVSNKYSFYKGQLLYSKLRPYLNKVVIAPKDGYCTTEILPLTFYGNIYSPYMQLFIMSPTFLTYVNMISYGVKMPRLGTNDGKNAIIAIPPIKEQKRIRDKFDIITPLFDIIQKNINNLNNEVTAIKSKILDLAIRGKLVPQDPNDEPASVLLERIRAEKEELIKQGKIKRDKKESGIFKGDDNSYYEKIGEEITCIDDEIPFEIPENWFFSRLKNIWELISGRDLSPSDYNGTEDGIPYITGASNFINGKVSLVRWTPKPQVITNYGDLLITCKGTIGEITINDFGKAHIARQIMAIRNIYNLNIDYLSLCLQFYIESIKQSAKGLIPGISREDVLNIILPVPPNKYQIEVVEAIQKYKEILNNIEASLN